jgi:hypothetical protein
MEPGQLPHGSRYLLLAVRKGRRLPVPKISIIPAVAIVLVALSNAARAGSKVYLGKQYPAGQLVSLDQIDHSQWDRLLKKYVDRGGLVDYAAWKRSSSDVAALKVYLGELGRGDPRAKASRAGKLAFWINAYNAVTIRGILREYPTSSIRNHTARLFGYNIWHDLLLRVGNAGYSLDTIEHKILRKLGEPRIHFAIVCASVGCPPLRSEAYTGPKLEAQLTDNTKTFFSRQKHFRVDVSQRSVQVSPILKWFREDFGATPQKGLAGLADYLPDGAAGRLLKSGKFSVSYLDYDWSLNQQ